MRKGIVPIIAIVIAVAVFAFVNIAAKTAEEYSQCPNGICEINEFLYNTCAADCATGWWNHPQQICGNFVCEEGEDKYNCPIDCNTADDGFCIYQGNEHPANYRYCCDKDYLIHECTRFGHWSILNTACRIGGDYATGCPGL